MEEVITQETNIEVAEKPAAPEKPKKHHKEGKFISRPLLKQSFKANFMMWLILTLSSGLLFMVVNLVLGPKGLFVKIDMATVNKYVEDEGLDWLKVLGLLQIMGFKLNQIQVMATVDLNSIMNDLVFKIAGALLPMIYVIITSNKLIAAQVNDGSMAYVLSTPTNRKKVIYTQALFLFTTTLAMYLAICIISTLSGMAGFAIAGRFDYYCQNHNAARTIIYTLASFICMFALAGFCFGCSAYFNKSKYSLAFGGGLCVLSFLCCILGLFGNKVFVATGIGVEAMNVFNYFSIFTLMDTESLSTVIKHMSDPTVVVSYDWVWKLIVLFAFGAGFTVFGGYWFVKKDLPL